MCRCSYERDMLSTRCRLRVPCTYQFVLILTSFQPWTQFSSSRCLTPVSTYKLADGEQYSWWWTGLEKHVGPVRKTLGMVTCSPAVVSRCHTQRTFPALRLTLTHTLRPGLTPRHVCIPGSIIIRRPLKSIFFKLFRLRSGELSWGCVPKLRIIFAGKLSRVETWFYYHHVSDYSSDVLAPLIGWRPGQLPGCTAP